MVLGNRIELLACCDAVKYLRSGIASKYFNEH